MRAANRKCFRHPGRLARRPGLPPYAHRLYTVPVDPLDQLIAQVIAGHFGTKNRSELLLKLCDLKVNHPSSLVEVETGTSTKKPPAGAGGF